MCSSLPKITDDHVRWWGIFPTRPYVNPHRFLIALFARPNAPSTAMPRIRITIITAIVDGMSV